MVGGVFCASVNLGKAIRITRRGFGGSMKKKIGKQGKQRVPARHEVRTVHAKRRRTVKKKKIELVAAPWLRIVPNGREDEPGAEDFREPFSRRNGRRQPRDLDLYTPGDKPGHR